MSWSILMLKHRSLENLNIQLAIISVLSKGQRVSKHATFKIGLGGRPHAGRYSYANQRTIAHWNLVRFAETLLPLLGEEQTRAITIANEVLGEFPSLFEQYWFGRHAKEVGPAIC